jgi:diguanylate cyclase (GGDEF)-like protein/PAS domain S-box-containing protein
MSQKSPGGEVRGRRRRARNRGRWNRGPGHGGSRSGARPSSSKLRGLDSPRRSIHWTHGIVVLGVLLSLLALARQAVALDPSRLVSQFQRETWSTRDGLPEGGVYSLHQADDGALLVGTHTNLLRYDGTSFEVLIDGGASEPPFSFVRGIEQSPDGTIHLALVGGLGILQGSDFRLIGPREGLRHPYLYSLLVEGSELLLGSGGGGLTRSGAAGLETVFAEKQPSPKDIRALGRDLGGTVWIGADEGLFRLDTLAHVAGREAKVQLPSVYALAPSADGSLWIGTSTGVFRRTAAGRLRAVDGLSELSVRALLEDRDRALWIGTTEGLFRFSAGVLARVAAEPSAINCLAEDKSGALWAGSEEGLARYRESPFVSWGVPEGLPQAEVFGLLETQDHGLVALDADGRLLRRVASGWREVEPRGSVVGRGMLGMAEWQNAVLIAADSLQSFGKTPNPSLALKGPLSLVENDGEGLLWVETSLDGLSQVYRKQGDEVAHLLADRVLEHVQRVFRDRQGTLWISTGGTGLFRIRDGETRSFETKDGLPSDTVYGLAEDDGGRLWVATRTGLAFVEGERVVGLGHLPCLPKLAPVHVFIDETQRLWASADDGVYVVPIQQVLKSVKPPHGQSQHGGLGDRGCVGQVLGRNDGLRSLVISWRANGQALSRTGELCYATARGVACIHPRTVDLSGSPAPARIRKLRILGEAREPGVDTLRVVDRRRPFEISFSAPDLEHPEALEFRTRLVGYDDNWSSPHRDRTARYTNLAPGQYKFEVDVRYRGRDFLGTPASARILVEPRWFETNWFRVSLALAGLLALGSLFLFLQKRAIRTREIFEARLQERTQALASQVEETERAEETLLELAGDLDGRVRQRTTELEIANRALRRIEERYQLAVLGAEDGIWDWDIAANVLFLSPRWKGMLGYGEELPSTIEAWLDKTHPDDRERLRAVLVSAGQAGGVIRCEYRMIDREGSVHWVLCRGVIVAGPEGPVRAAGSQSDITTWKEIEKELSRRVTHDHLTGLPNRTLFVDRLGQALLRARAAEKRFSVVVFNIDKLKTVNETRGLAAGDRLLEFVASHASRMLSDTDTLARLGSDEFGMLLLSVGSESEVVPLVERLRSGLILPAEAGQTVQSLSISVGVRLSEAESLDAEALLKDAFLALANAKARGSGNIAFFTAALRSELHDRLHLEGGLRRALRENQFELYYQPLVALGTGLASSVEALIRWNDPSRGVVGPGQFLSAAEASGLLPAISRWVLREACAQARRFHDQLGRWIKVSINLSPALLNLESLEHDILTELAEAGALPAALGIEIVETSLLETDPKVLALFERLRRVGVTIAIDDFGTGYSSFSYLSKLPVDCLKIDRSLVHKVPSDQTDSAICRSIVLMAKEMGVTSVVEGVETAEQVRFLREIGCDLAQGYYFAKPMPAAQCLERLTGPGFSEPPKESSVRSGLTHSSRKPIEN